MECFSMGKRSTVKTGFNSGNGKAAGWQLPSIEIYYHIFNKGEVLISVKLSSCNFI